MLIVKGAYSESNIITKLEYALQELVENSGQMPLFLCIGSDRHILDCFGPLVGSMLKDKSPHLEVFGTLPEPLHARNLVSRINHIKETHPARLEIAIDASLGNDDDLGTIRLRYGPLLPGKALSKRLPPLGDVSITGVVGTRSDRHHLRSNAGSLNPVYGMAQVVSEAVARWHYNYMKK